GSAGKSYYDQPAVQAKVAALKTYLETRFHSQPLHGRALALWASSWLPGVLTEADRQQVIEELLHLQEADGGWSLPKLGRNPPGTAAWNSHGIYPEGVVSDGYATGLVVLAVKRAGVPA